MNKLNAAAVIGLAMVGVAGCATKGDIESLRSEIAGVRAIAESAEQKAAQAAEQSARAAEDARMASEKADRIFRSDLRK